jgi:uncharacterized protein (TIGR02421 family)
LVLDNKVLTGVDQTIADCTSEIRLFYHLAPCNEAGEKARFLGHRGRNGQPSFTYRSLEFDAKAMRQKLDEAPVGDIDDEALGRLYAGKLWELDRLISLLEERGNARFLESSIEVFGRPPDPLVRDARQLLADTQYVEHRDLEAEQVCALLEEHLEGYRRRYTEFDCEVVLDEAMSAKMYVHENRIHVKKGAKFSRDAALCDTVHEIDAHVVSFLNGHRQPLRLFEIGPRGTLAYQESLGVFTEMANGVMFPGRMIAFAARVVAVASMVDGAGFAEVFELLTVECGLDEPEAFLICVRVFRGGGFTKDWLYVAELDRILRYWAKGGDMEQLLLAKVTMDSLEDIEGLVARGLLKPARYLPAYLDRISDKRTKDAAKRHMTDRPIKLGDLLALELG